MQDHPLSILGSKYRKNFTAIDHYVNLAARLEIQARFSEILVEEITFNKLENFQNFFSVVALAFKGTSEPIPLYSWLVK